MARETDDSALLQYFSEVGNGNSKGWGYKLEAELSERIKKGDLDARNELVEGNLRFVIRIAKNYQGFGLSLLELISAGNMGLFEAAEKYENETGFKFITYAVSYIRKNIIDELAGRGTLDKQDIRIVLAKVIKVMDEHFDGVTFYDLTDSNVRKISEITKISKKRIMTALIYAQGRLENSLDKCISEDSENDFNYFLADDVLDNPEQELTSKDFEQRIENALSSLGDWRAEEILRRYYGFGDYTGQTLEQIGGSIGLTRERVRQIRDESLKKLRKKHGGVLSDFLYDS